MKVKLSKEFLIKEYEEDNKSVPTISKNTGHCCSSVYRKMKKYGIKSRKKWTVTDYTNRKFGNWLVLEKHETLHSTWLCECRCGIKKYVKSCNLLNGSSKKCNNCTKTGYGEITGTRWCNIKNGAIQRKIEFKITVKEAWELFLTQKRKCALTGEPIWFAPRRKHNPTRTASNASLDRIDSKKGYSKDNVQWVLKSINMMKQSVSQKEFVELCKKVVKYEQSF